VGKEFVVEVVFSTGVVLPGEDVEAVGKEFIDFEVVMTGVRLGSVGYSLNGGGSGEGGLSGKKGLPEVEYS